jgi:hypothetical protein
MPDFWWLPQSFGSAQLRMSVGHHDPLGDDEQPCLENWLRSLDSGGVPSTAGSLYPLSFVASWQALWRRKNVYRTLELFDALGNGKTLGPFFVDIDNSDWVDGGYQTNLDDALMVTRQAVDILGGQPFNVQPGDMRVFFSGRKGFNIEVRPESIGIELLSPLGDQIACSAHAQELIVQRLRVVNSVQDAMTNVVSSAGTVLDRVYRDSRIRHPFVRLHNSLNEWIDSSGAPRVRGRIEVVLADLQTKDAQTICFEAEAAARAA